MLASTEPESQKTTLSLVGLKAIGDKSNFCGSDSTTEAIDGRRCSNPFPFVLDDSERSGAEHKMLVGSLNAAAKNTVTKGAQEKIAGLIITKNLKQKEKWELKVLSGRLVWLLMSPASLHFEEDMEDNYDSVAEHVQAMRSSDMPRDFLSRLVRWFIPVGHGSLVPYQDFHKEGSIILKSLFTAWGPRKLKSNAHLFAAYKMIESEVKESGDPVCEQLFVEIFKDHETFVNTLFENLKKVEEVENKMMGRVSLSEADAETVQEPLDVDKIIEELMEKFAGESLVFISKFFKIIHKGSQPTLAVAHPRVQKKAGKLSYMITFKGLSLKTDCASLTNLNSDVMYGRGNTGPTFCTLIPLKDLSSENRDKLLKTFNMEIPDIMDDSVVLPSSSQDFPFTQSQTQDTIKICEVCRFATRDKMEMRLHMNNHVGCETCGKFFSSQNDLDEHIPIHEKVVCTICNTFVQKDAYNKHKETHEKVKNLGMKLKKTKIEKPVTGYSLWQKDERRKILASNPSMIFTEVSSELGRIWRQLSKATKEEYKASAKKYNENWLKKLP